MAEPEPLLAPLLLAAAAAAVTAAGALANCSLLAILYRSSERGIFSISVQLTLADIALSVSLAPEVWSYNARGWPLGHGCCVAQRGLAVLASTASSYLVATFALHILATANLEEKELMRRNRRSGHGEDDELRSSRHSLVAASDSSTPPRTMNLDYRGAVSVPITQPSLFVWILSLSLSIPDFALATTVNLDQDTVICTIVDSSQRLHLYIILALLNLVLIVLLLIAAISFVAIKLKSKSRIFEIEGGNSIAALKLSLWLLIIYFISSAPRSCLNAYNIFFSSMRVNNTTLESVRYDTTTSSLALAFSSVYLGYTLVRPLLCIVFLPRGKRVFTSGVTASV